MLGVIVGKLLHQFILMRKLLALLVVTISIEVAAQDHNADKNAAQVRDSFYYKAIAEPTTSFIQLKEGYKIFSEKIGHGKIKILFVHGGPGNTHEYFDIFKKELPPDKYNLYFMTNWAPTILTNRPILPCGT